MLTSTTAVILLGNIAYGKTYNFTYTVKNEYINELTIDKVVAGCRSCTEATIDNKVLAPGEEGTISVAFTPGRVGKDVKSLTVINRTGGRVRPNLLLQFKYNVT